MFQLLAFVILCFAFAPSCSTIVDNGDAFDNSAAGPYFEVFVIIGFFFIITVQLVSAIADKNEVPIMVRHVPQTFSNLVSSLGLASNKNSSTSEVEANSQGVKDAFISTNMDAVKKKWHRLKELLKL